MRLHSIALAASLFLAAGGAAAQSVAKPPGDGTTRAVSTQRFVQLAMANNRLAIESSELALAKARDERVKQFAQASLTERKAINGELAQRAQAAGVALDRVPRETADAAALEQLGSAAGDDFDRAYAKTQLDTQSKAVALFTSYADAGEDVALRALAQRLLPDLEQQLEQVRALQQQGKG